MNDLQRLFYFYQYFTHAKSANSIHSPFVFDLYTNLICDKNPFYAFDRIEDLRLILYNDPRKIKVEDYGTGKTDIRKIKSIAKRSGISPRFGQLLFRLVNKFHPKTILELGTSLGLGTLYLALPDSNARVITLEGSKTVSDCARQNFEKMKALNIRQVLGNFDNTLPEVLNKLTTGDNNTEGDSLDFVFFDGNHRKEPTIQYFKICLPYVHNETIFVFDDIYWSKEMYEAWKEIKSHSSVKVSIDLFRFGIIFFREELSKQDFVLRF